MPHPSKTPTKSNHKSVLARQSHDQFQLTITIPQLQIKTEYQKLLKQTAKDIEISGFRKGKAPLNKVEQQVDKNKIYQQIIQQLLPNLYLQAIAEHQLKPIIDPQITIINQQLDINQDWQIRAVSAEKPQVKLGDYQKQLKGLLKSAEIWTPDKGQPEKTKIQDKQNHQSPEDLKAQQSQKITQWLITNIGVEPAQIIIEQHANQLLAQLLEQIQKLGLTLEQYLTSINKNRETLKAEYAQRAQNNLKLEFIILAIGEAENIKIEDQEINALINQSKDPKIKEALQKPEQKHHLHNILFREKILDHLFKIAS